MHIAAFKSNFLTPVKIYKLTKFECELSLNANKSKN